MAKKGRPNKTISKTHVSSDTSHHGASPVFKSLTGSRASFIYIALYFCLTVFLFRDFLFNDVMLFGSDTIPDGIYTRQYYKNYHAEYGGVPRWNPFILGGMPFIDAMHGDTFYPGAWLAFFMPLKRALGHKLVWHVFLAGVFMYIFLRVLIGRKEAAFLGGLMYMLAPSFVSWLYGGHDAKMYIIALLPLAFAFLEAGMKTGKWVLFVLLGGVMGLLILTSQIQMAYYSFWAIGLYLLFRLFTIQGSTALRVKRFTLFVMAVIVALSLGAVQLLPSYMFTSSQSVRSGEERTGYEYATSFAMNFEEAAGMIVPSFPGFIDGRFERQENRYWGKNPLKLNTEYHGILPLLLGLMALLFYRNKFSWFFLGLALLAFIYCLGANTSVYRLFYEFVPGIKNFRAPSMMIFLFCFSAVVLTSHFVSVFLDRRDEWESRKKWLIYLIGIIAVVSILVSVMGEGFFRIWRNVFYRDIPEYNVHVMASNVPFFIRDLWKTAILAGAALAGLWMFVSRKIGAFALVVFLAVLIVIDDLTVDTRFITVMEPETFASTTPDAAVQELKKIMSEHPMPFRILGIVSHKSPNYYAMFGIQAADGFHNNELRTYERFKGGRRYRNYTDLWLTENAFDPSGVARNNFLKVAGVRYIILPVSETKTQLFENKSAFDRAFIVHESVSVPHDSLAVAILVDSSFNPARTVILTGEESVSYTEQDTLSRVENFSYTKDGISINADFKTPGFLVVTENWVPYWDAKVDGKQTGIKKAFGTFMALECPQGFHEIHLKYVSKPYERGKMLTLASLVFIVLSMAVSCLIDYVLRRRRTA